MPPVRNNRPLTNANRMAKALYRKQSLRVHRLLNHVQESADESAYKAQAIIAARTSKSTFGLPVLQGSGKAVQPRKSHSPADACIYCLSCLGKYSKREEDKSHCAQCLSTVCL